MVSKNYLRLMKSLGELTRRRRMAYLGASLVGEEEEETDFDGGVVHVLDVHEPVLNGEGEETGDCVKDILDRARNGQVPGREGFRFAEKGDACTYRFGKLVDANAFCDVLYRNYIDHFRHHTLDYQKIVWEDNETPRPKNLGDVA